MMGEKTTERISTLLTPEDKEKFKKVAHADSRNVAALLRKLALEAIAKHERQETSR